MSEETLITTAAAAQLVGVTPAAIRQAAHRHRIAPLLELWLGQPVPLYRLNDLLAQWSGHTFTGFAERQNELVSTTLGMDGELYVVLHTDPLVRRR